MGLLENAFNSFTKLFGSKSERDLKKYWPIVDDINEFGETLGTLSDEELKQKTVEFKAKIVESTKEIEKDIEEIKVQLNKTGEDDTLTPGQRKDLVEELDELDEEWLEIIEVTLREIMPEAFAVLKETCRRFVGQSWEVAGSETEWNMIPYDVQLVGAITLHEGKIAEMKTGEGKTLVAIFPCYLNALVGRGVHVITVNTYLAQRDAEWNEPIFNFHGLTVDCIDRYQPNSQQRREAYKADVTYGTNNEFGFDYLRDNMVGRPEQMVQRQHHYTIVDEVDSVLIDEARTPLIISGPVPQDNQSEVYIDFKPRVQSLVEAQKRLVGKIINEGEKELENNNEDKAGLLLLRAQRGFPKNKKFIKLMQDPSIQKLVQKTEYLYLQENAKHLHKVDDELYFSVDYKLNSIEMTDKGRDYITRKDEDPDFFVIPDVGTETSTIEQQFGAKEPQELEAIQKNGEFSDDYKKELVERKKEELAKAKSQELSKLHRLFAERSERIHAVNQLLKAYTLFENDDEYILQEGKVQIVDEHTGRVLPGRRYSDGLHQAIEAKENVKVEASTQTYATITLQNYFRMYHKLAGMTGTAVTEESEFFEIYKLEVIEIPTNRPIVRDDKEDMIFRSKREKYNAVIEQIREFNDNGQPVLVGTTSVEVSETLGRMLTRAKINHNVLNAKQHKRESDVVKSAGQKGAVTIATNMAGRGTDIKINDEVRELGGLAILGTERHESRRIDLQLRGRAGRQGDPGVSQFFVSLEDDLMKLFGGSDKITNIMDRMNFDEGEVIQHPWITKALERAQKRVEQNNFSIRKRQLDYDDVLNNQRTVVYSRRKNALLGERLTNDILDMLDEVVHSVVTQHYKDADYEAIRDDILRHLAISVDVDRDQWATLGEDGLTDHILDKALTVYRKKDRALAEPVYQAVNNIERKEDEEGKPAAVQIVFTDGIRYLRVVTDIPTIISTEGKEVMRALERSAVLSMIDEKWMEHLRELDALKEGIGLRAYGQKDPLIEYKKEAFNMFRQLVQDMNISIVSMVWKAVPEQTPQARMNNKARDTQQKLDMDKMQTQHESSENMGMKFGGAQKEKSDMEKAASGGKREPVVVEDKPGRNDPCPCGSGKKYKQCHGR